MGKSTSEDQNQGYKFGTFKGVFVPSLLTILGVIMYMRFGWVLGNVGLFQTLLIVIISTSVTLLTGLSISTLATNMKVGGGGAYYIISRSLGVEVGTAIGLPLFFSQALGIAFYSIGFAESISTLFPIVPIKIAGVVTLVLLTMLVYFSAEIALKAQLFIFVLIIGSLISFFAGGKLNPIDITEVQTVVKENFWVVFAVFFPAVTGILSGVSMSGDLKNPSRSLPLGTIGAISVSLLIYIAIPIFLIDKVNNRNLLITDPLVMRKVAYWGWIIIAALWGATLSSAIGTLLGAPRILQALAKDRVIPSIIGRGFGKGNDPRIATFISFLIGLAAIMAGDLNMIAPILSMFFLTTYGLLNLSAAFEGMIASPYWRPKFKIHWIFSLVGAFACFAIMFMINAGATFISFFFSASVYYIMKRRSLNARWGDTRYGIFMLLTQYAVFSLAKRKPDERTWLPNILVLSGSPSRRMHLIELADAILQRRGFLSVCTVLSKNIETAGREEKMTNTITEYLRKKNIQALIKVHMADTVYGGLNDIVRTYGFGPITPNTILLGKSVKDENIIEHIKLIKLIYEKRKNIIIIKENDETTTELLNKTKKQKRIDIWWGRQHQNGGLMVAIGYMLSKNPEWSKTNIILKTIVDEEKEKDEAYKRLNAFVTTGRLEASTEILVRKPNSSVFDNIQEASQGADLVCIGMREANENETDAEYANYYTKLMQYTKKMPLTAIVLAAQDINFKRIFN